MPLCVSTSCVYLLIHAKQFTLASHLKRTDGVNIPLANANVKKSAELAEACIELGQLALLNNNTTRYKTALSSASMLIARANQEYVIITATLCVGGCVCVCVYMRFWQP